MDLDKQVEFYWTKCKMTYPIPFKTGAEKKLYVYISKLRFIIIKQSSIWITRNGSKTLDCIHEVMNKLSLASHYLQLINTRGYRYFGHAFDCYDKIDKKKILLCFYLPRGKGVTEELKEEIRRAKIECSNLLDIGFKLTANEKSEIISLVEKDDFIISLVEKDNRI